MFYAKLTSKDQSTKTSLTSHNESKLSFFDSVYIYPCYAQYNELLIGYYFYWVLVYKLQVQKFLNIWYIDQAVCVYILNDFVYLAFLLPFVVWRKHELDRFASWWLDIGFNLIFNQFSTDLGYGFWWWLWCCFIHFL